MTDDGIPDLLVIYKEGSLVRFVTAIGQDSGGYVYTDPIPAPIENQGIQFKNIDNEGEMEFIISAVGTAGVDINAGGQTVAQGTVLRNEFGVLVLAAAIRMVACKKVVRHRPMTCLHQLIKPSRYPRGTLNIYKLPTAIWISRMPPRFRLAKNTLMMA